MEYIIYCSVLISMRDNHRLPEAYRGTIRKAFGTGTLDDLLPTVKQWTIGANLAALGGLNASRTSEPTTQLSWADKIGACRSAIKEFADDCSYWVFLDELDEDYEYFESRGAQFNELMAGLFRGVISANAFFRTLSSSISSDAPPKIRAVAVLRDDIFSSIRDNQRNSWMDHITTITLNDQQIWKIIEHRIEAEVGSPNANPLALLIDLDSNVRLGTANKTTKPLAYIKWRTQMRVRDNVMYMKFAAQEALRNGKPKIDGECIKNALSSYSSYLRREIEDEMLAVLPNINSQMRVFSILGKSQFRFPEFLNAFERHREESGDKSNGTDVAEKMFRFNVIGNLGNREIAKFYYDSPNGRLNRSETLSIHHGLLSSLLVV